MSSSKDPSYDSEQEFYQDQGDKITYGSEQEFYQAQGDKITYGSEQEFYQAQGDKITYGSEQEFYQAQGDKITYGPSTVQRRKIDPMGLLGKIFAIIGAFMIVVGVLIAAILSLFNAGEMGAGFFFIVTAGAWGTGLVFFVLGLIFLLFFKNIASADVVERYLAALAHQDYATAFQYFDPGMVPPQNEQSTQDWFIQRAQAYDENGPITDYSLREFQLANWGAQYRIKIRRGARSYIVTLFLTKNAGIWKIARFSSF